MRDFILSDITGGNKAPFSKRSLEHLNEMTSELNALMFESLSDYASFGTELVIVRGCIISGSMPGVITWTAGIIYYQGDFYRVDAGSTTINVGQTAVWNYSDTYISGDPATYSDTNTYNFHRIRKMTLTSAASGSGLKNYNSVKLYRKFSNSTSFLSTPTYSAPVASATIANLLYNRCGNVVQMSVGITVTTTGSQDEISVVIPITNAVDFPDSRLATYYAGLLNVAGNVSPAQGSTAKGASGYIAVDTTVPRLLLTASLPTGAGVATWELRFNVQYSTEYPFADY